MPPRSFGSFQTKDAADKEAVDTDAAELNSVEMVRMREQSLSWLRAELEALRSNLDQNPEKLGSMVQQTMQIWQRDTDFDGVRGEEAVAKLPESERRDWQKLWEEVAELERRAAASQPR